MSAKIDWVMRKMRQQKNVFKSAVNVIYENVGRSGSSQIVVWHMATIHATNRCFDFLDELAVSLSLKGVTRIC